MSNPDANVIDKYLNSASKETRMRVDFHTADDAKKYALLPDGLNWATEQERACLDANDCVFINANIVESSWVSARVLSVSDGVARVVALNVTHGDSSPVYSEIPMNFIAAITQGLPEA